MEARDIILKPVITEKAVDLLQENKYVFKVRMDANKIQIKQAVEEIFKVKVVSVNTMHVSGKKKRMGRTEGKTSDWKKAIVELRAGDTIEVFEGM